MRGVAGWTASSAGTSIVRLIERDGLIYANDGDWVESLSALAEDPDGTLRLLTHTGETRALIAPRVLETTVQPQAA